MRLGTKKLERHVWYGYDCLGVVVAQESVKHRDALRRT